MSKYAVYFDDATGRLKRVQNIRYDSTSNALRFYDSTSTHFVGLKANDSATIDSTYTMPTSPVNGAFLRTDSDGVLSWGYAVITKNEYSFDVANPAGQTDFDTGFSLNGKYATVLLNGVLQREGASYDYLKSSPNASSVSFNNTVPQNAWVKVIVENGTVPSEFDVAGPTSTIETGLILADKYIQVYLNGALQRQGGSYDWYTSGTQVLLVNAAPANAWIRVLVF
jgi:hypothetical protein